MTMPLLTTKLYVPSPRPDLVPRPRLAERLDEGLRLGHRLTLVAAPAGFGKTTLIVNWIRATENHPVAWLSLDEGDNDPVRFFSYLVAALRQCDKAIGQATQSVLGAQQLPPAESLVTLLINDIAATSTSFILVLDDYQLIHNAALHAAMAFLLERQPPHMHTVIATRTDPPLSLPRLRARGEVTEIRADDLRFTPQEAATFLNHALGLALDSDMVATLEARTEGWIAGLQLAALSMQGKQELTRFVNAFSGSNRHVIDYLADEVLARQPDEIRQFMLHTSILDRLCALLCDAVLGIGESMPAGDSATPSFIASPSQEILERLERNNLFVTSLDEEQRWYRYHRLLADFLRTELDPQRAAALHLRAAHWLRTHNLLPEAVNHALAYANITGDMNDAARTIALAAEQALPEGALATVLDWMDALPENVVRSDSRLATLKASALLVTGQVEAGKSYLQSAEASLRSESSPVDRGRILSLRCYTADAHDVLSIARQALHLIGEADLASRSLTLFMLADAQDAVGDVTGAIATFQEAQRIGQQCGSQVIAANALGHWAISLNTQGKRREALTLCQRGAAQYCDARGRPFPAAGLIHTALGELEFEANNLERAHEHLQLGLMLGQQSSTMSVVLFSMEELARLQQARGESASALATIQEAKHLALQAGERHWAQACAAVEAQFYLDQGNLSAAERWADNAALPLAGAPDLGRRYAYLTCARVLLAQNRLDEAGRLLSSLVQAAQERGLDRWLLALYILQASVERQLGDAARALTHLEQALRLAAPEGYARVFFASPSLAELLVRARHVAPEFVDKLLAVMGARERGAAQVAPPLIHALAPAESLSERELHVLRLMAADLSAPEMAEQLVVAVSTVQSHVKHIYHKLDAHSRYEAVERARALGLI